eukprot:CAMPEP_0116928264 /NCGR_PEP_ID=MMETSP0467-20121206/25876_1 /TAXON_ID=283647 /ORGANISM="Mesodinium pulex, Strain SPMC105" /LENGTH=139 /DNA_ID=CAMNT_0004607997 /DNA_START=833 /DNA_END=1249 /DNA_ORIENTATION=-
MLFGGQGLFFLNLKGPGRVYIQGLSFDNYIQDIAAKNGGGGGLGVPLIVGAGGGESNADSTGATTNANNASGNPVMGSDTTTGPDAAEGTDVRQGGGDVGNSAVNQNQDDDAFTNTFSTDDHDHENNSSNDEDSGMGFS